MENFNYDTFCDTIMVALTFLVSLTFFVMLVIHLLCGVGATSLLWELVVLGGSFYLFRYSIREFKNLKKIGL